MTLTIGELVGCIDLDASGATLQLLDPPAPKAAPTPPKLRPSGSWRPSSPPRHSHTKGDPLMSDNAQLALCRSKSHRRR
ncbi:hypothetical protein SSOG_00470 [Streptomyces himastatinicus ATCC 53653]|uniref:Uncharacterized protein n=1 Tax=Streptomyces himastatinicus ATCC 53653 TaxID=457427 RepID=D9WAW4_9ACTN|nr:hypothetical protein SSOG_00470 [Streptomyces himastatinicus ATCC 53653]